MGKGKRRGGLSGVSKFVLESIKSTSSDTISNASKEKCSLAAQNDESQEDRPAKKRRRNNGVPINDQTELADSKWVDKYDATGLVAHYTHHSQVPEHLQKCMSQCAILPGSHRSLDSRFFAAPSIFFSLFNTSRMSS